MTAGKFPDDSKFHVYRGTAGGIVLAFESPAGVAVDLTGRTFSCEVRRRGGMPLVLAITATVTDAAGGEVTLSWTEQQTQNLKPGKYRIGLIDSNDVLWIEDECWIEQKTPDNV